MSDGDNATPGRRRRSDPGDDNHWLTRTPRPSLGAAPWERGTSSESEDSADAKPTGNHTDGVTVADLIAKVTGTEPASAPARHRAEPEPEAEPDPPPARFVEPMDAEEYQPPARDPDTEDTEVIPVVSAYASELPDLSPGAGRVPPSRIGDGGGAPPLEPHHGRRRAMFAGRALAAVIAVLALALTGGAWQWQSSKNNMLNRVSALDPGSRDILDPNAQFGDENFLIVGVDSRFGENSDMGAGDTEDAGGARSDTVMLVNIPANRERVVVVSFPRDLAITPIECEAWDPETGEYGPVWDEESQSYGPEEVYTETKLNSAYSFGGPKCLVKVIQKLSGLSVNRFMAVDFAGFSKMVDALGGVEVCSTTPLEDYELGTVLPTAGRQIDRRAHRAELCPRTPGDHRDQRRLRPHQAPAAVPVVAAAFDDLQGSLLLPEQAQQRRQPVHRRQLRGQHRHQGTGGPRSVDPEYRRRADHLLDRPDYGIHGRLRQRAFARR